MIAGLLFVPRSRHLQERVAFDWIGLALFLPAVAAVISAISFGNARGWTSPAIAALVAGGLALGMGFVWRERRSPHPMLDIGLFRRRRFSAGIASGLLCYLVMFGVLFLVPFYLERGLGFSASRAGIELMVMPLALGVAAPIAGRVADRLGERSLTVAGMTIASVGLLAMGVLQPSTPLFLVLLASVGAGLGLFIPPNNAAIMGSVPEEQSGVASGVLNMTRGMGTALGLALTGLVFEASDGQSLVTAAVEHAFLVTAVFLAAAALVAGLIAGRRGGGAEGRLG
jgi:predicted MFS family arabinose efflux permease